MPSATYEVNISWSKSGPNIHAGTTIQLCTREEVEEIAAIAGGRPIRLPEGDPRLDEVFRVIEERYGFKPAYWNIVPKALRDTHYQVNMDLTWSQAEIDAAELLWFTPINFIASPDDPTIEEALREEYISVKDSRQRSKVLCGSFSPSRAIGVAEPLKTALEESGLIGVHLRPVIFRDSVRPPKRPIWALRSTILMPPTITPIVNNVGEVIPWNYENTEEALRQRGWGVNFERGGRRPGCAEYRRSEIQSLMPFDIAEGAERTELNYVRRCYVSQRFRAFMEKHKVSGSFRPVEIVDD